MTYEADGVVLLLGNCRAVMATMEPESVRLKGRDNSYLIGNQHAKGNDRNRTSFQKGNLPWNKGLCGLHLSPTTEFKTGHDNGRKMPLGSMVQRRDKQGKARTFIKRANGSWIELARYLWEKRYGWIKGDVVHHLNGDALDDRLENLIAIPRSEHPKLHSRWWLKQPTTQQIIRYESRYPIRLPRWVPEPEEQAVTRLTVGDSGIRRMVAARRSEQLPLEGV